MKKQPFVNPTRLPKKSIEQRLADMEGRIAEDINKAFGRFQKCTDELSIRLNRLETLEEKPAKELKSKWALFESDFRLDLETMVEDAGVRFASGVPRDEAYRRIKKILTEYADEIVVD